MSVTAKRAKTTIVPAVEQVLSAVSNRMSLAVNDVSEIPTSALRGKYAKYILDPKKFIQDVLGVSLTKDAQRLCDSIVNSDITLARSANGVGKSHLSSHLAVWFFMVYPESKVFLFAAPPERNLRQILWAGVETIYRKNPYLFEGMDVSMSSMMIKRHSESYLTGLTIPVSLSSADQEARFSGKHAPDMAFFGDETDAVPNPVFKGIESCASGGHVIQSYNFNPRQDAGTMSQMEKEKRANVIELSALRHPNVISGKNLVPGAVTQETTIRRINMWTRPLSQNETPDVECFKVPNFLVGKTAKSPNGSIYPPLEAGYRKVTTAEFFYMVLGKYPAQSETQLISRVWINRAEENWSNYVSKYGEQPPYGIDPIGGADIAEFGADMTSLFFRYDWFVPTPQLWQGVDTDISSRKIATEAVNLNAKKVNIDSNGVGSNVSFSMRRHYGYRNGVRVMPQELAPENIDPQPDEVQGRLVRDEMLWSLREWLRTNPKAAIPPMENLREDLLAPKYSKNKNGKIEVTDGDTLREILKRSPDWLMGLALTFAKPKHDTFMERRSYSGKSRHSRAPSPSSRRLLVSR